MSVIRKLPFIESVIKSLTKEENKALLDIVNSSETQSVAASLQKMPEKGIRPVYFALEKSGSPKTGILVYTDDLCVLLTYHRFQDMLIFDLNPEKETYKKVNEYLDINELRRVLSDLGGSDNVSVDEIDSDDAAKGLVITSDGEGGAEWEPRTNYFVLTGESGDLTEDEINSIKEDNTVIRLGDSGQMYYKNSQNNYYVVFKAPARVAGDDTIAEIITVDLSDNTWSYSYSVVAAGSSFTPTYDNELNDSSTNAPQTKVVYDALENKANVDGNYPTMTVGLAGNLDTKIIDNDVNAYLFRPTGGLDTESGNNCKEKAIVGGSLGFNQLWQYTKTFTTTNLEVSATNQYVSCKFLASDYFAIYDNTAINLISGHKYLILLNKFTQTTTPKIICRYHYKVNGADTYMQFEDGVIFTAPNNVSDFNLFFDGRSQFYTGTYPVTFTAYINIFDLTAMFGSTIADYIYSLEQATTGAGVAWFKKYFNKPYYPYTPIGSFVNVITRGKKAVGFNAYNDSTGEAELYGGMEYQITGVYTSLSYTNIDGDIESITPASNGNFTPNKDGILTIVGGNATNTCVHLGYDHERDGEFEEHREEIYENDPVELIGIPHIDAQGNLYFEGNKYLPSGTVEEDLQVVVLNGTQDGLTSTSTITEGKNRFYLSYSGIVNQGKGFCARIPYVVRTTAGLNIPYYNYESIEVNNGQIIFYIEELATKTVTEVNTWLASNNIVLIIEKSTPTTSSATPYPETQWCDNWGTEERLPPLNDTRPCEIPVGHDTDYPLDLKSKLEIMPNSPANDGDYVLHSESGVNTYVALGSWLSTNGYIKLTDIPGFDVEKTQTLKNIEGTLTWVTEE